MLHSNYYCDERRIAETRAARLHVGLYAENKIRRIEGSLNHRPDSNCTDNGKAMPKARQRAKIHLDVG